MFFEQMHPTWQAWLAQSKPLLESIEAKVLAEKSVLPEQSLIMRAFKADPKSLRAVILGQDPYPTRGDAIGLAFAVEPNRQPPKSLINIYKELESDLGVTINPATADLSSWSSKGVFLLNSSLTTIEGEPAAHSKLGWQVFTKLALTQLVSHQSVVVLAWGNHAKKIATELGDEVTVIESAHPSPLSANRGFLGSKPFSRANQALDAIGLEPIDWSL